MKGNKIIWTVSIVSMLVFLPTQVLNAQNFAGRLADDKDSQSHSLKTLDEANVLPVPQGSVEPLQDLSRYTLGVEDVISIQVLRHPEVSGEFVVNKEGKIQYEFVGDLKVVGHTKDEVKNMLTELLSEYIISPQVTVKVTGYNSKVVYVIGEVARPGKIFMRGDIITVREALVEAGLPLLSASMRKCPLITPSADKKPIKKFVDVFSLIYEGDLKENLVMKPGDTLYIPATIMAKTMRVLSPISQPIGTAAGTGRTVTTGF